MKKVNVNGCDIIVSKWLPWGLYVSVTIYGWIFFNESNYNWALKRPPLIDRLVNHERIHVAQMRDFCKYIAVGGTIYYLCYFFEWLFNLVRYGFNVDNAQRNISFEKEAKGHAEDNDYIASRKRFAQWKKID